jgi:tRNA threonylcarbamoyladenosine biosynthesis protein TsaE
MDRIVAFSELPTFIRQHFIPLLAAKRIFTFEGQLGAGKSSFIKEVLKSQGVEGVIASPTFTYVNRYKNKDGVIFYHFDLYRIETLDDFFKAGFDEYLHQEDAYCFIEWPLVIAKLLAQEELALKVLSTRLSYDDSGPELRRVEWGE